MSDLSTIRHASVFDPTKNNVPVTIIGAGATGSRIWLALVELGLTNITVYDFDHVEAHNLANQIYLQEHIGMPKVEALADYYLKKTGRNPPDTMRFINQKVEPDQEAELAGILFLLTDTMKSRREILKHQIIGNSNIFNVIETRMASSYGNVFQFNPFDQDEVTAWENSLIDDDDAEVSLCGSSISVGTTASVIANIAVWQFMLFLTQQDVIDKQVNIFLKPLCVGRD